jgi:hypothetical protein
VKLADVAQLDTLARAFWRASRGKRDQPVVRSFAGRLDEELATLGSELRAGTVELGRTRSFEIFDPKPRVIHAPCFRERVVHHALFDHVGPVLDRALVADTFACREGKGSLAAVQRAQQHVRRFPWFVKADMRAYFASVTHDLLLAALARKLRDRGVLELCARIIRAHEVTPGRGLPIGALSSQHFANFFLAPLDRLLLEQQRVAGMVRYMDDVVAWCRSRAEARSIRNAIVAFAGERLNLEVKQPVQIQRSACGLSFLGFRVFAGSLRLSRRRRRRHARARQRWEHAYALGRIDARALQAGYGAALAITAHADARSWRREQLRRAPEVDA